MKGLSGSETQGMFGVAATESEAQTAKGTLLSGSINWLDTKGGKEAKTFTLPNRAKGEKLWVFVTTDEPLTSGQSVSVAWGVDKTLTLDASSPAVVVKEYTVQ
ncbi:hypothetical protein PK28_14775 [Hymenobacter sp. DG25B]|nr:hypothetical protein PK28_14775 [Hymenobacter sp. DG25B]